MRNILKIEYHYRFNLATLQWELQIEKLTAIDTDKLWIDDIINYYNSGYNRPLVSTFDDITLYNHKVVGCAGLLGSINRYFVFYTEHYQHE